MQRERTKAAHPNVTYSHELPSSQRRYTQEAEAIKQGIKVPKASIKALLAKQRNGNCAGFGAGEGAEVTTIEYAGAGTLLARTHAKDVVRNLRLMLRGIGY